MLFERSLKSKQSNCKMNYSNELIRFSRFLSDNTETHSIIKNAANPNEIVEFAKANGFDISVNDLRVASRHLTGSYWSWTGKSREWRQRFFNHRLINDNT